MTLLSSFSADAVCQRGASLPGDRSLLFGSGSREVTALPLAPTPPPPPPPPARPVPPVPSRQARRSLPCLVETAPLRLARSAAVRAQLRLAGTHVARFHLWVSVWPRERVDISMLMHANADTVASTRVCTEERRAEAHHFQQRAARRPCAHLFSRLGLTSPLLPRSLSCPPLTLLVTPFSSPALSLAPLHVAAANLLLKHVTYTRSLSLLPRALTCWAVMLGGTGSPLLRPPPWPQQFYRLLFADIGNEIKGRG